MQIFPTPVQILVLFKKEKCYDGMGTQADKTRKPASPHPHCTFDVPKIAKNGRDAALRLDHAGVALLLAHDSCLDDINRAAHCRSNETCHQTCAEMRLQLVLSHVEIRNEHCFEDVVGG